MDISVDRGVELWGQVLTVLATYGLDVVGALVTLIIGWIIAGRVSALVRRGLGRLPRFDPTLTKLFRQSGPLCRHRRDHHCGARSIWRGNREPAGGVRRGWPGDRPGAAGHAQQCRRRCHAADLPALQDRRLCRGRRDRGYRRRDQFVRHRIDHPDNVQITAPNGQLLGAAVKNYSHHPTRRIDLVVGIAHEDDIDHALAAAGAVIEAQPTAFSDPEPTLVVGDLGDSSVNLIIRVWCNRADYWTTLCALIKAIKERYDQDGISIPYPQRTVHMVQPQASA